MYMLLLDVVDVVRLEVLLILTGVCVGVCVCMCVYVYVCVCVYGNNLRTDADKI